MIKIEDFTNQELINAIVEWIKSPNNEETHACDLADDLKSGIWLDYYNDKLEDEK